MKFYTNKISTAKSLNFSDFIEKIANSNAVNIKTASAVTKIAQAVANEEECLEGKQENLPTDLKKKIVDKKIKDGECDPKDEKSADEKKSDGAKNTMKKEECYASAGRFVKIANLDEKTKSEWKSYWKKLYPSEYVDAMFADK
jgi:hypothetical protein